ncbi:hypothetical protein QVD17_34481 [Tagetes erecta]|uniref:Uncharacterized protein n=1 Tax=Tagetes erecta TaxID=13708 RepID=A0AAD8NLW8_TARER|nr:hypothetical protein QVD17_34481 [Tagetes erecta]
MGFVGKRLWADAYGLCRKTTMGGRLRILTNNKLPRVQSGGRLWALSENDYGRTPMGFVGKRLWADAYGLSREWADAYGLCRKTTMVVHHFGHVEACYLLDSVGVD